MDTCTLEFQCNDVNRICQVFLLFVFSVIFYNILFILHFVVFSSSLKLKITRLHHRPLKV